MKKRFKILYIVIFMLISLLPMLLFPFVKENAQIEKRTFAAFPSYIEDGHLNRNFGDQFEAWFNDHIPLRAYLLSAANRIQGEWLHAQSSNVIVGKQGWLFFNSEKADYLDTNALTDHQVRAAAVTLSLIQENIESRGGHFLFVPAPNKSSVYGEYMPAGYQQGDENNLDRISARLGEYGVKFADLKGLFLNNKEPVIYHRRDSHWNYRGALLAFHEIMSGLEYDHESLLDAAYTVKKDWRGDLDKLLYPAGGTLDDQYYYQIEHDDFRFIHPMTMHDAKTQLAIYMSDKEEKDDLFTTRNSNRKDGSTLYMVRDSFGRALLPYMIDAYENATFKRTDSPDLVSLKDGTDLVYEIAERNLARIIAKAPFMYAPERDDEYEYPDKAAGIGDAQVHVDTASYGVQIYGALPEDADTGDGRVYISLRGAEGSRVWEAFPIYEEKLLGKAGEKGFSMYLPKEALPSGQYAITVITGNVRYDGGMANIK